MSHSTVKSHKNKEKPRQNRGFYGCGGRTRTYDLRVMSPTSFQLLYSAIFGMHSLVLVYSSTGISICQALFSLFLSGTFDSFLFFATKGEVCENFRFHRPCFYRKPRISTVSFSSRLMSFLVISLETSSAALY